ncbi:hypothetical protein BH11PSE7_BH11PSE7_29960 [soil metagenome]
MSLQVSLPPSGFAPTSEPTYAPPLPTQRWVREQFSCTDDGAGGRLQTLRRSLKFWWRCWWHAKALQTSAAAFENDSLASVIGNEPTAPLRPLRSYLRQGLSGAARARAVQAHFTWLSSALPRPLIDRLYREPPLALLGGLSPVKDLGLALGRSGGRGREGEMSLHLEWKGQPVMTLVFSVLDGAVVASKSEVDQLMGLRPVVGALQGARGTDVALRELASSCQRLRPSALLIVGLQGLCEAWGLKPPLCVATQSHIYTGYRSRRRKVGLDYDAAWRESGATAAGRHYWALPAAPQLRPDTEVESRKRAQHRRRNALRQDFFLAARDAAAKTIQTPG